MGDVRRAYRAAADTYIGLVDGVDNVHPEDVAFIEQHLGSEVGGVLDAGCGPGHLTAHLCDLGVRAMGVDFTPEFIDHARNAHPCAQFRLGSLSDLAEPDGAFAELDRSTRQHDLATGTRAHAAIAVVAR